MASLALVWVLVTSVWPVFYTASASWSIILSCNKDGIMRAVTSRNARAYVKTFTGSIERTYWDWVPSFYSLKPKWVSIDKKTWYSCPVWKNL